jgi:predicted nucleotide-binding protein (sugar kinase/HSP70/actin superfamily)
MATMKSIAIPNVGNYAVAFGTLGGALGLQAKTCLSVTPEMLALGICHAPESCCLPFKAYLGHFIKAAQEGVEYGVMVNSIGSCRLHCYAALERKILKDLGHDLHVFDLGYDGIKPPLFRHFDAKMRQCLPALIALFYKARGVDLIEANAWKTRPRELRAGDTTAEMDACLRELTETWGMGNLRRFLKEIPRRFEGIPQDKTRQPLKVGLLGECAVLRDRFLNHNVEETLGELGAQVRNFFQLGAELQNIFNFGIFNEYSEKRQLRKARPYLQTLTGGHALDSVANALRCAEAGFDGVAHLCPAGCMPEVSVKSILRKICRDKELPLLELTFDEHTAHAGVCTRLEAFVDVMLARRRKRTSR